MSDLKIPSHSGAILLPDCILFPGGAIPLHIFEPRYRKMLDDAMEGNCLFCIGNLLGDDSSDPDRCAAPVGTIGLIRASRETPDGTSNLLLHGLSRIRFDQWISCKSYPYAKIRALIDTTLSSDEQTDAMDRLRKAVNRALAQFPSEVNTQVNELLDQLDTAAACTDAICQQFLRDPSDRQRMLETLEVRERIDFLIQFLENANPPV